MMFLNRWSPQLLSVLRIMTGLLFMEHGTIKFFQFPPDPNAAGGGSPPLLSLIGLAGLIELVGGALMVVGLWTRIIAFIASGEMAIAYFMAHAPRNFYPARNNGELAIMFCFVFLYIAAAGPGPWSVDAMMRRGRTSPAMAE
jgi:putative oxidoreductase